MNDQMNEYDVLMKELEEQKKGIDDKLKYAMIY
jgi:hypothetical protein